MSKVVHCKKDTFDVYIGRPSKWGNPFVIGQHGSREEVITMYEVWILGQSELLDSLNELKGKVLGCWCSPLPCHGDVLVRLANDAQKAAKETVGELVERLGEREAYSHIVAYNITLRQAMANLLDAMYSSNPDVWAKAIEEAHVALEGRRFNMKPEPTPSCPCDWRGSMRRSSVDCEIHGPATG